MNFTTHLSHLWNPSLARRERLAALGITTGILPGTTTIDATIPELAQRVWGVRPDLYPSRPTRRVRKAVR